MKKINLIFIIIFSTVVSIFTMGYCSYYANKPKHYEEDESGKQAVIGYNKAFIPKENIIIDNQDKMVKKVEVENSNTKEYLEKEELTKKKLMQEQKNSDNLNVNSSVGDSKKNNFNKDMANSMHSIETADNLENFNYNTKQQEQSVFKVATGKIEESLTTSDKIKLLYISFQIGKENYKKVEEYLNAVDAEEGVLKALKLLKEDLSKKEYEKVRKIAGKFIDMDAVEMLK